VRSTGRSAADGARAIHTRRLERGTAGAAGSVASWGRVRRPLRPAIIVLSVPELPEAERARSLIADHALGRRIVAVEDHDRYVSRPHPAGEIASALVGQRLTSANRVGKTLWCQTDRDSLALGLHLGMAGRIAINEPPHEPWDRFAVTFEDGTRMALRDKRRLGRAILAPDLSHLGPDAEVVTRAQFRARVGRGTTPIKARIMDQSVIAGIGNLLADETLWQARIDPRRLAADLSESELDELRRAMRAAVRLALQRGGAHTGKLIQNRTRQGRCPRCGTPLSRARIGGRTTYWCPHDQR
jgi:formamidopyrimidine-DNA glycosylase